MTAIFNILMTAALMWQEPNPEVFIGQLYPSGNVYVKSFSGRRPSASELLLVPVVNDRPPFNATLVNETMQPAYIPAIEAMDDQHDSCGSLQPRKLDISLEYLSDEFFDSMIDYCETNEDVAMYRASPSAFSYMVLGFRRDTPLMNVRIVEGPRPMTPTEVQQVTEQKAEAARIASECTTEPAYLDSAARLLEAEIGDDRTLRLSSYKTPGCAGHLATIYIIDILRGTTVLTTFQLTQNQGLL
jgi:hypothetical protein